jgi:hypothetical protein
MGFQEPWQLLWVLANKACRQWEFRGLISNMSFRECSSMALLLGQENKAHRQRVPQKSHFPFGLKGHCSVHCFSLGTTKPV